MDWNEERLALHYYIGVGIAKWAHVEQVLGEVLVIVERTHPRGVWMGLLSRWRRRSLRSLGQEFVHRIRKGAFRAALALVDSVVRERVSDAGQRQKWKQIRRKLEHAYLKRNALAHCAILNDLQAAEGRRVGVIDWWNWRIGQSLPNDAIFLQDVYGIDSRFTQAFRLLKNFSLVVQGQTEDLMPEELPPTYTLAQIEHEIRVQISVQQPAPGAAGAP